MSDNLKINVTVLDRTLQYTVRPEDETYIRKAVKSISAKLSDLKSRKTLRDNQEALTIVLIQIAYFLEKMKDEDEAGNIAREIRRLDQQLDEYLENNMVHE